MRKANIQQSSEEDFPLENTGRTQTRRFRWARLNAPWALV